jgi:hypothetical protein
MFNITSYIDYSFSKILVLTDGLCGSACSLFASKLRYHGKAALLTFGGRAHEMMDSSSFAGGNVLEWDSFIRYLRIVNASNGLDYLPTTAITRFNFRQMYCGNERLPRGIHSFHLFDFSLDQL